MANALIRQSGKLLGSHTEFVRYWVIASLSISCVLIAAIAVFKDPLSIYQQLFYVPILYAAYYYPKRGIFLAGALGLVYQTIAYFVLFPNVNIMLFVTAQVIVFIIVAMLVSLFSSRIHEDEKRYRQIFDSARLGILLLKDDRRTILEINPYLAKLLDYRSDELRSISFRDLFFRDGDCHAFLQEMEKN